MTRKFKKLRHYMVSADFMQNELAKDVNIAPSTLSFRLQGKLPFTAAEMKRIGELLHIPENEYFDVFVKDFDGVA